MSRSWQSGHEFYKRRKNADDNVKYEILGVKKFLRCSEHQRTYLLQYPFSQAVGMENVPAAQVRNAIAVVHLEEANRAHGIEFISPLAATAVSGASILRDLTFGDDFAPAPAARVSLGLDRVARYPTLRSSPNAYRTFVLGYDTIAGLLFGT